MRSVETVNGRSAQHHAHSIRPSADGATEQCPWCGQAITRDEYNRIRDRIEAEGRARVEQAERSLTERFAKEKAQSEVAAKVTIEKAQRTAAKAAEQRIRVTLAQQDAVIAQRLAAQKVSLDKSKAEAINAEKVKAFEEKTRLTEQLAEMQRRLEARTAHELGEPAEVDLSETLVDAFPGDRVWRVVKGQKGPDVVVEIVSHGEIVGKIVVDCKNHARWANSFTKKLRADQLTEGADFAILSSSTFPKSARQLHLQDGVLVADPARVVVLVNLLRRQLIENRVLRLAAEARNEKADRLYSFITSAACADLLDRVVALTTEMKNLDQNETATHQKVWTKRSELIRGVQQVQHELTVAFDRIIGIDNSEAS